MRESSEKFVLGLVSLHRFFARTLGIFARTLGRLFARPQPLQRLPQFIGALSIVVAQSDLGLHVLGARLQHVPTFSLFSRLPLGMNEWSNIFDPMNDQA